MTNASLCLLVARGNSVANWLQFGSPPARVGNFCQQSNTSLNRFAENNTLYNLNFPSLRRRWISRGFFFALNYLPFLVFFFFLVVCVGQHPHVGSCASGKQCLVFFLLFFNTKFESLLFLCWWISAWHSYNFLVHAFFEIELYTIHKIIECLLFS